MGHQRTFNTRETKKKLHRKLSTQYANVKIIGLKTSNHPSKVQSTILPNRSYPQVSFPNTYIALHVRNVAPHLLLIDLPYLHLNPIELKVINLL